MDELEQLFTEYSFRHPAKIEQLPGSGSNRKYFRITGHDGSTMIGVVGTSVAENEAFIAISRHFRLKNLPVPEVYAVSRDHLCYLQQDFGDEILFDTLAAARKNRTFGSRETELLKKTMSKLAELQTQGAKGFDFSVCYPQAEFDERMIFFDLNYFKYCFLKATGTDFSETALEDDFNTMSRTLLGMDTGCTFMYRDFQARNVMLSGDEPRFIDFQGGRRGPVHYDVASFIYQAKACYPDTLKEELLQTYLDALRQYIPVDDAQFRRELRHFRLFRILQTLGAYGFRGYFERKEHFLQSIPFSIENLKQLLQQPFTEYPYLSDLLLRLAESGIQKTGQEKPRLTVRVMSFAYKKGMPYDPTGNGGGYVFDCRAIHNPGKYDRYKQLTGKDAAVVEFLETDGEVFPFLESAYALVDTHVRRFVERGFANMIVAFGCTGGQHRSVYCAERMAEHLKQTFDIEVRLEHREHPEIQ